MLGLELEKINISDIERLIEDKVSEGKYIEYKKELYRFNNKDQKDKDRQCEEFLKDASSFANTAGGDLIIGVEEENTFPIKVVGIEETDIDSLKLRMNSLLQTGLEPRIRATIKEVPVSDNKYVLIIRVQNSLLSPHRVHYQRSYGQFWARSTSGAYQMDTTDLRQSFALSGTIFERMREFHRSRSEFIRNGEESINLPRLPKLVYHLIPIDSLISRLLLAPKDMTDNRKYIQPMGLEGCHHRLNIDGMIAQDTSDFRDETSGYTQIYRNGIIESATTKATAKYINRAMQIDTSIFKQSIVSDIFRKFKYFFSFYEVVGINCPIWVFCSFVNAKNTLFEGMDMHEHGTVDRNNVILPEVTIEKSEEIGLMLKRQFDALWNSSGIMRCNFIGDDGKIVQ